MRRHLPTAILGVCALAAGCSSAAGGSGTGKVTGTVTYNGAPAPGARVMFCDSSAAASPAGPTAITDEGGKYAVVGVKPGDYKVVVYKLVAKKGLAVPDDMDLEQLEASGVGSHALPGKYSKPASTTLTATVKRGSNEVNLTLEGKVEGK